MLPNANQYIFFPTIPKVFVHFITHAFDPYSCTDDVIIQFARSSGAGGQNVNKVNTKVDMRLRLDAADWIAEEVKAAIWRMVREQRRRHEFIHNNVNNATLFSVRRAHCESNVLFINDLRRLCCLAGKG